MSTAAWTALVITVLFGGGGLGSLVKTFSDRRKNKAETVKAKADTEASMAAAAHAIAGAGAQLVGALLGPAQKQIENLEAALERATAELGQLRSRVNELTDELERRRAEESR